MGEKKSEKYKCTLSPQLLEKAIEELGENPNTRLQEIHALRERLVKYPGLNSRQDDAFLLRFLRARKFNQDKAFQLLINYYKMKFENPDLFKDLKPSSVRHVLIDEVTGSLSQTDTNGGKVMLLRPGKWDPDKFPLWDIFRANFLGLSKVIEDEATQVNGISVYIDLKDFGWNQAKNFSPAFAKKVSMLLQDAFPARFKGLHYINEPVFFDYLFALLRPFLREKLVKRLHFHGPRVEELAEFVKKKNLPEEYGGDQPPYSNKEWAEFLLKYDTQFEEEAKYGFVDMTLHEPKKSKSEDAMESMSGTYRKL